MMMPAVCAPDHPSNPADQTTAQRTNQSASEAEAHATHSHRTLRGSAATDDPERARTSHDPPGTRRD
jgi:hypothetical protein